MICQHQKFVEDCYYCSDKAPKAQNSTFMTYEEENNSLRAAIASKKQQLAASQAENLRLREAMQVLIDEHEECSDADGWMAFMCSPEAIHVADEALSTPPGDRSALLEVIARVLMKHGVEICEEERLSEVGTDEDRAYNTAIKHCVQGITKYAEKIRSGEWTPEVLR